MKFESQHRAINHAFDDNIDAVLAQIYGSADTDHARMAVDDLKTLVEAKKMYNESRNDLIVKGLGIAGTVLSIGMILAFEQNGIITTKALGFAPKPKI